MTSKGILYRILFIIWVIYRIVGIALTVIILSIPFWLITGKDILFMVDSYFDRICPKI